MATKLTRALHLPRLPRAGVLGVRSPRASRTVGAPFPGPVAHASSPLGLAAPAVRGWGRRALWEGLVASLLTSLLTSAVLAAPEAFRQSPVVTWRHVTTSAVALDQGAEGGVLVDCP